MDLSTRLIANRIKLRHLVAFLEVAGQRSFARAADVLALTQPALSRAIAELETELGVPVFVRSRRGVELTPFGEAFRAHAGAAVASLRQGIETVTEARRSGTATVSLGALPTVVGGIVPQAIATARARGLNAVVRVHTGPNDYLLDRLRDGRLDLVVGRLSDPVLMSGLAFEHLYSEEIVVVVRAGHPLDGPGPHDFARLAGFTVMLPTPGSIIRPDVERLMIARGFGMPPDLIETVSPAFGLVYLMQTDAVWIISRGVVAEALAAGRVVQLAVDTGGASGPVGLTRRADPAASPAADLLVECLRHCGLARA